jgi:serine/threonine protein kinase
LTGRRLFTGDNDMAIMRKIQQGPIDPPSKHNNEVIEDLDKIILKLLSRDPDQRYPDAAQVASALDKLELPRHSTVLVDLYREFFPEEPEGTGKLPTAPETTTKASGIGTVDAAILVAPWRKTHVWLIALGIFIVVVFAVLLSVPYFYSKKLPQSIIEPKISIPEPEPAPPAVEPDPEPSKTEDGWKTPPPVGEGIGERAPLPIPKETAAPAPKPTGRLFLNAIPWAKVYRGKKFLGDTPIEDLRLPIGKHKLRLVNDELKKTKTVYLVIRKNKITRKTFDMKEE